MRVDNGKCLEGCTGESEALERALATITVAQGDSSVDGLGVCVWGKMQTTAPCSEFVQILKSAPVSRVAAAHKQSRHLPLPESSSTGCLPRFELRQRYCESIIWGSSSSRSSHRFPRGGLRRSAQVAAFRHEELADPRILWMCADCLLTCAKKDRPLQAGDLIAFNAIIRTAVFSRASHP